MHELSVTQSIVELVQNTAAENQAEKVTKIKVKVGELTCIQPDALEFCFSILREGTIMEEAEIVIENVPVKLKCLHCGALSSHKLGTPCQFCSSKEMEVVEGKEFYVESIDIE